MTELGPEPDDPHPSRVDDGPNWALNRTRMSESTIWVNINGFRHDIRIGDSMTLGDLKSAIAPKLGIPPCLVEIWDTLGRIAWPDAKPWGLRYAYDGHNYQVVAKEGAVTTREEEDTFRQFRIEKRDRLVEEVARLREPAAISNRKLRATLERKEHLLKDIERARVALASMESERVALVTLGSARVALASMESEYAVYEKHDLECRRQHADIFCMDQSIRNLNFHIGQPSYFL